MGWNGMGLENEYDRQKEGNNVARIGVISLTRKNRS